MLYPPEWLEHFPEFRPPILNGILPGVSIGYEPEETDMQNLTEKIFSGAKHSPQPTNKGQQGQMPNFKLPPGMKMKKTLLPNGQTQITMKPKNKYDAPGSRKTTGEEARRLRQAGVAPAVPTPLPFPFGTDPNEINTNNTGT